MSSHGRDATAEGQPASFVYPGYVRMMVDSELDCVRRFVIGDAYARFCRDQGDTVLFALGIESSSEAVEREADRRKLPPDDLIHQYQAQMRQRFERLGVSCDWPRTVVTSELEQRRRVQRTFLAFLERDLVYRREIAHDAGVTGGSRWFIRSGAYAEQCERGLENLPGWTSEAIELQRQALGRVNGIELNAGLLGGGELEVFTPYTDSISDAAFVSISPNHPEIDAVASETEVEQLQSQTGGAEMVQTGMQAVVPGVEELLPVVVAASVDARFGPTASIGIPDRDEVDREIAGRLQRLTRMPFKAASSKAKPREAVRYRLPDLAISRIAAWGTPVPVVHCPQCTIVPMDVEPDACSCPRCGGPARRDSARIDASFSGMWIWLSICVPPAERKSSELSHAEFNRWLPARRVIWSANDGEHLLHQRVAGGLGRDLDMVSSLGAGEPFTGALVHGTVDAPGSNDDDDSVGSIAQLDNLVARVGADVARLAILHAAAPAKSTAWSGDVVRHSQRFLAKLRECAESRLGQQEKPDPLEIDRSTHLRRRLAAWCRVAEEKITANMEHLEMHRATFNTMLFFKRIQDFEARCASEGELEPADRDAIYIALRKLLHLAAPLVPNIAAELSDIARQ